MFAMPAPLLLQETWIAASSRQGWGISSLLRREVRAHFIQTPAQRAVVNRVPDPYHRAAQQRRIQRILRFDFFARQARQRLGQFSFLRGVQFHGGRNLRLGNSLALPDHLLKRRDDLRQKLRAVVIGDHKQKIADDLARPQPRDQPFDHTVFRVYSHRRAGQKRAQLGRFRVRRAEIAELLESRCGSALSKGNVGQSVCVLEARGLQFGLPARLSTKLLMRFSCAFGVSCLARSDSAPSTASFAASAFRARRAARSAASISPFAAAAIFCASDAVSARMRPASAAASRWAKARSSATSFWRFTSFVSASRSCASAAAFATAAPAMAEPTRSRARRSLGVDQRFQAQTIAKISNAKLIHLKISVARPTAAPPPSSAACAPATAKSVTNRMPMAAKTRRFRVIGPLSRERQGVAGFAACAVRFPRKAARPWLPRRGRPRPVPLQSVLSLCSLRRTLAFALP